MPLRIRLTLAFAAIGSLMLIVGLTSYVNNRRTQDKVAVLRSDIALDLRRVALDQVGLEIEGYWSSAGVFVALDVEVSPGVRRPKIRGVIQAVGPDTRTITMYGQVIRVDDDVEHVDDDPVPFEELEPGLRVEVTCKVDESGWRADKLRARDVKGSDKIKGTATAANLDDSTPGSIEIEGLVISLPKAKDSNPESALRRIELATRITMALNECRALAYELVGRTGARDVDDDLALDRDSLLETSTKGRLLLAKQGFEHHLGEMQMGGEAELPSPTVTSARWIRLLLLKKRVLDRHFDTFLARLDEPILARSFLDETFSPFLDDELLPLVYAFRARAEEQLGDQLRAVVASTNSTTTLAMRTSVVAVILAFVLGFAIWRSIHRPLKALHQAAVRIGEGRLDTRVEVRSKDEIGVLAEAFNRMTSELSRTTLSIASLENVFDSMAGAIVLVDLDERITNVNQATVDLVGYSREELVGRGFDSILTEDSLHGMEDTFGRPAELAFLTKAGRRVPVSFSRSELRTRDDRLTGYACLALDLTERKDFEARLRRSLAEKELLLREIHHRVKNNLQVISSLLSMQSSQVSEPQTIERFEESQSRIRSMALIHEQLYQSTELSRIDMPAYLGVLTEHVLGSNRSNENVRVDLDVEELVFDVDSALACGLILNELVTNSLKHAFPDGRAGVVEVVLRLDDDRASCRLSVSDDGSGPEGEVDPSYAETLGLSLVSTLARQLRGEVSIDRSEGFRVSIDFPYDPEQALAS